MAEINLVFDTSTKKATCTVDGQMMANLREVSLYQCGKDEYCCSLTTADRNEDQGMTTYTHLVAADGRKIVPPEGARASTHPGLVMWTSDDLEGAIARYLER